MLFSLSPKKGGIHKSDVLMVLLFHKFVLFVVTLMLCVEEKFSVGLVEFYGGLMEFRITFKVNFALTFRFFFNY